MKKIIFFEIIRKLKSNPALMRKAQGLAIVGLVGVVLMAGLTLWAGIAAVNYLTVSVNQVAGSPILHEKLKTVKSEFQRIEFQPLDCWGKAQSLASFQPWIERPALENLRNLKVACLNPKTPICQGLSCEQINEFMNTAEGRMI